MPRSGTKVPFECLIASCKRWCSMRPWCKMVCWKRERPGIVSGLSKEYFVSRRPGWPRPRLLTSRSFSSVVQSRGPDSRNEYSTRENIDRISDRNLCVQAIESVAHHSRPFLLNRFDKPERLEDFESTRIETVGLTCSREKKKRVGRCWVNKDPAEHS